MADPQTDMANVLAVILNKASKGGASTSSTLGSPITQTPSGQDVFNEGQSVIDQATQKSTTATPDQSTTTTTPDVQTPGGTFGAVGLGGDTKVSQGYHGDTAGQAGVDPGDNHPGIDLAIPVGTPLVAAESGTITAAGNTDPNGYGNEVEITAPDGTVMRYGHLSAVSVSVGQQVNRGASIGKSGGIQGAPGSGNSEGPHLHFEVRQGGSTVDPVPFLAGSGGVVKGTATANPAAQAAASGDVPVSQALNIVDIAAGKPGSHELQTQQQPAAATAKGTGSTADNDPGAIDAFLGATRQHESGGDYHIYNQSGQSNASGAYQFLNSTWKGAGGTTEAAAQASPEEQDRVARNMAMQLFNQFHSWRLVAIAWYGGPGIAQQVANGQNPGSPQGQGPYLAYGDTIARMMQGGK